MTTQSGGGEAWHNGPVTVTLDAVDAGCGVAYTEYSTDGGSTWTTGTSLTVSDEGIHTIAYRSADDVGNVENAKTTTAKIDMTEPTTTQTGADSRWHNHDVTVTFAAQDAASGIQSTTYSTDGGVTWQTGTSLVVTASADHANDGANTILYRSTDGAGNLEASRSCEVRIDTSRPATVARKEATVRRGSFVTLTFRVNDLGPGRGTASVVISVRTLKGKSAGTHRLGTRRVNADLTYRFRCNLAKGTYRFFIHATDAAGNREGHTGYKRLVVK